MFLIHLRFVFVLSAAFAARLVRLCIISLIYDLTVVSKMTEYLFKLIFRNLSCVVAAGIASAGSSCKVRFLIARVRD